MADLLEEEKSQLTFADVCEALIKYPGILFKHFYQYQILPFVYYFLGIFFGVQIVGELIYYLLIYKNRQESFDTRNFVFEFIDILYSFVDLLLFIVLFLLARFIAGIRMNIDYAYKLVLYGLWPISIAIFISKLLMIWTAFSRSHNESFFKILFIIQKGVLWIAYFYFLVILYFGLKEKINSRIKIILVLLFSGLGFMYLTKFIKMMILFPLYQYGY